MSSELFAVIEEQGLIDGNEVNLQKIQKLTKSEIIDFAYNTKEITSSKHMSREKSAYAFSSATSLSGDVYPCSSLKCRLEKARNLAQFSALYSDRVYIDYFPSDYVNHVEKIDKIDLEKMQERLANDLAILSYYRPLIQTEKIIPITHPHYCAHCLTKSLGENTDKRFKEILPSLKKRYREESVVTVEKRGEMYRVHVVASEVLIEHGGINYFSNTVPNLDKVPHVLSELDAGKKVTLTSNDIKRIKLDEELASHVHNNLVFELASTQTINTRFLTDRDLDIDAIKKILGDPTIDERNQLVQKYFNVLVPFIEDADPEELLKIRQNEGDAFIVFRKGLNQIVDEYRNQKNGFTEKDAQEIYGDVIEPKLAQLNDKVLTARKKQLKDSASKILGWAGAISFGWYAGLLPTDLATAATTLGLVKVIAELAEGTLNKSTANSNIRDEPLYFLWKVKKKIAVAK